jgi:actin-related protein
MDRLPACVFDIGSSRSKIGFAGNHHPQFVLPSAVGLPSKGGVQDIMDYSIGEEALRLSDLTRIRYLKRLGQVRCCQLACQIPDQSNSS